MTLFRVALERSSFYTNFQPKGETHYIQAKNEDAVYNILREDAEVTSILYVIPLGEVT